jgi:transcription termination/antitermination protein NusA
MSDALGPPCLTANVMNEDDRRNQREVLTSAVQEALLSAAKEAVGPLRQLRVVVSQATGDIHALAKLRVAERVVDKHNEISLHDARRIKQQAEPGEELEVDVTPADFARVAARFAKQALMEQLRRAEERL